MLRAIASVGALTLLSRITGFARDIIIARYLGAGPIADAFVVAFRLPNQFRTLFAEGAFQAAFVPSFTALIIGNERDAAKRFGRATLTLLLIASLSVSLVLMLVPDVAIGLLAPGMINDPQRAPLAITYLRYTGIYLTCMSVMAFYAGLAQVHGRFAVPAAAPMLLNFCLIAVLLFFAPAFSDPGLALAIAVPLAGIAQALVVGYAAFGAGERLIPGVIVWSNHVRSFLKRLGPAMLGSGVVQISAFADTIIVSFLPAGQIAHLYYADRLYQLPFGVVGLALSTVVLPTLSRAFAENNQNSARQAFAQACELALTLSLPVAALLIVGAHMAVSGLFGYGAFSQADVTLTAAIVAAYAFGIPAGIALRCLVPTFQAKGDTATPTKVAALVLAVSITLKVVLAEPLGAAGIAAATAIAAWLSLGILSFAAWRARLIAVDQRLWPILWRVVLATCLAAIALGGALQWPELAALFESRTALKAPALFALGASAIAIWALTLWLIGYRHQSIILVRWIKKVKRA